MADVGSGGSYQQKIQLASDNDGITFYASPEMEESGSTIYISLDDIRAPASILIWMGSPGRTFNINAKFIARTQAEAVDSAKSVNLLRAWRTPTGNSIAQSSTPEVLGLSGYGNQFMNISVVIQSLNISFPTDVDYIDSGNGFMVPIVWPVSITLREYHTKDDMTSFDYGSYKAGTLEGWT